MSSSRCSVSRIRRDVEEETCTIEEREEFEPLVEAGITVYAGVDYEQVLRAAETRVSGDCLGWRK